METHFKIIGFLLISLAVIHISFPKYFNWKAELKSLSLINKQMMTVHTFFIGLTVFLMGLLCLTSADGLLHTRVGHTITLGLCIFWLIRLFFQLFIYSPKLWKGMKFETIVHVSFTIFWIYVGSVFLWATIN